MECEWKKTRRGGRGSELRVVASDLTSVACGQSGPYDIVNHKKGDLVATTASLVVQVQVRPPYPTTSDEGGFCAALGWHVGLLALCGWGMSHERLYCERLMGRE